MISYIQILKKKPCVLLKVIYITIFWNNKTHKAQKKIVIQEYANGGIKMVDCKELITALKAT